MRSRRTPSVRSVPDGRRRTQLVPALLPLAPSRSPRLQLHTAGTHLDSGSSLAPCLRALAVEVVDCPAGVPGVGLESPVERCGALIRIVILAPRHGGTVKCREPACPPASLLLRLKQCFGGKQGRLLRALRLDNAPLRPLRTQTNPEQQAAAATSQEHHAATTRVQRCGHRLSIALSPWPASRCLHPAQTQTGGLSQPRRCRHHLARPALPRLCRRRAPLALPPAPSCP